MQLEADRRIVLRKISRFKRELKELAEQRALRRSRRESVPVPSAAIVGYTNAGKSSLLNALTGASVDVADELFKTLDSTTRNLSVPNGQDILLTDTVGFIRKLPHDLVDAFKSTLEEAALSDFLIVLLDASDASIDNQFETTQDVLQEIGAGEKPSLIVLNKCDRITTPSRLADLEARYPDSVMVSAKTGLGLDELITRIRTIEYAQSPVTRFVLPASRHDLAALVHRTGRIVAESYEGDSIVLTAQVPERTIGQLRSFVATP